MLLLLPLLLLLSASAVAEVIAMFGVVRLRATFASMHSSAGLLKGLLVLCVDEDEVDDVLARSPFFFPLLLLLLPELVLLSPVFVSFPEVFLGEAPDLCFFCFGC